MRYYGETQVRGVATVASTEFPESTYGDGTTWGGNAFGDESSCENSTPLMH